MGAPREQVFDLWTDLERGHEWIEGLTRITDVTGPVTTAGTRYTAWFGRMRSPTEVLEVDRPRLLRTRFGSWLLRGVQQATFEDQADGTRLTQEFWTNGIDELAAGDPVTAARSPGAENILPLADPWTPPPSRLVSASIG